MAIATVQMSAAAIGGTLNLPNTGTVQVPASGLITVDTRDAIDLIRRGGAYVNQRVVVNVFTTPRAASAGRLVASTTLSNGTLTIANQPDVPRQGAVYIDPGTSAITAGNVAVSYVANDGTSQVDNFSAVMPPSVAVTQNTTKGIVVLSSVVVTAVAGGATPHVQVNDTNSLAMMVDPGFQSFALLREDVDSTYEASGQTVASSAASVTPSTAPNATHNFTIRAGWTVPDT
jgi:hypothetical protein